MGEINGRFDVLVPPLSKEQRTQECNQQIETFFGQIDGVLERFEATDIVEGKGDVIAFITSVKDLVEEGEIGKQLRNDSAAKTLAQITASIITFYDMESMPPETRKTAIKGMLEVVKDNLKTLNER